MSKLWCLGLIISVSLVVSGCSSNKVLTETTMYQQYPSVEELKNQLANAKSQEVDIFSPEAFEKANESYQEAVKLASKDNPKGEVIARDGLSQLTAANTNARQARDILEEVLTARSKSIAAGANVRESSDFKEIEEELLDLTMMIEAGKLDKAKDGRADVFKAYQQLELVSLKGNTVEQAEDALANARKRDVDDLAPKTLRLAQEEYQLALNVLDADRSDTAKAEVHASRSLWYAQRATQIAETIRHFESSDYSDEDKVLWYQDQLARLVAPIKSEISYNLPNKEVIKGLNADIQGLIDSNLTLVGELESTAAGKQQIAEEKEQALMLSKLEMQQNEATASKFAFVQSLFKQNEADVYRQTNDVLIRAHGFYFPVGKSEIESINFALLNKITEAVRTFPDAKIVVSGHTDNVGGDEMNMALSEARAEKVAKFLNQVGNIPMEQIEFYGYGKQKPVLSNETTEGRAANRRVEILIVNGSQPSPS